MFDLFRSQRKTVKYVLTFLLSMVALSMVVTLIPNVFSGPTDLNDPVLVEVGEEAVTINDLYAQLNEYRRANTPPDALAYMADQIINNLIEEKVLLQEAEELGVKPDDRELAIWLKEQMPFLWTGDQFNSAQYQQIIQQRFNQSIPQFERNVLKDLTIEMRLRELITDVIVLNEEDLKEAYRERNEMAKIRYALVDAASFASQVPVTDEAVQQYFEANKLRYRVQEKRTVKVAALTNDSLPEAEFSDEQIRAFYNQNRDRFQTPERVFTRHVLLLTTDLNTGETIPEDQVEEKKARAEEAYRKLQDGADFAEVAAEYSEDAGTAASGGELGWVVRGQYGDPELERAVFSLQEGQYSGVVKSSTGFHIVKVDKRDRAQMQPLENVREQIIADLQAEQQQDQLIERADRAVNAMRKPAAEIDAAAAELGLPVSTYGPFDRFAAPPALQPMPTFFGNLMSAQLGEPTTYDHEGTAYIGVVTEILPPRDPELSEVKAQVTQDYVQAEARKLAQQRADELLAAARESSLEEAASRFGLSVETSDFFKRTDTVEGFTSAQAIGNTAFDKPEGTVEGPIPVGDRVGVYEVAGHAEADMSGFESAKQKLREDRLEMLRDEAFGIFRAQAVRKYREAGKINRNEDRIALVLQDLRRG